MRLKALPSLLLLTAIPASAVDLDWTRDTRAQFNQAMAAAPTMKLSEANELELAVNRKPQKSEVAILRANAAGRDSAVVNDMIPDVSVKFEINNTGDRVGARLEICENSSFDGDGPWCEDLMFYFPQLTYDKMRKQIRYQETVVETRGTFVWNQWKNPDFKLRWSQRRVLRDDGFNKREVDVYSVHIESPVRDDFSGSPVRGS